MSFEKHSNFNKLTNFSEVKFGENKPVLEVELNEMQQIQNEARADIIRDTMPSGFVTLGEIDYDYCANNNNQIKLKTESIAYVNGYRITIPKDTVIEIGEADKVREDLVFLEVWKEAVNDIDTLTEYGGENNAVINNPIKDERYPVATSQRVALKYRIRHVADVDFSTFKSDGFHTGVYSNSITQYSNVTSQGGNDHPLDTRKDGDNRTLALCKVFSPPILHEASSNLSKYYDLGLYIAGIGDEDSRNILKTLDGYCYAIPMFRLKRKPHVGLASPFEYKKIHNQLDPKKFAHLVGQENVEKVHSVDIKGKTYKNLLGNGSITSTNNNDYVKEFVEPLNPRGTYTLFAWGNLIIGSNKVNFNFMGYNGDSHTLNEMITPNETETNFMKRVVTLNYPANYTVKWRDRAIVMPELIDVHYVLLEGDHTDTILLEPFNYLKSLGENTNNSITVENNLVEEGTYVPEIQNNILPTYPEVTHVTWGEDVVIPPEVEIELKNGEEVIQTITQLPVKLETTGEEKLHVKTMKGRTLVNLYSDKGYHFGENVWAKIHLNADMVKPNTKYIALVQHIPVNCRWAITNQDGSNVHCPYTVNPFNVFETTDTVSSVLSVHINTINNTVITITKEELEKVKPMIIEYQEGMENWGLKYFEGMQSVKMPVLKTTGKNLFDIKEDTIAWDGANIKSNSDNTITFTPNSNNNAGLSGNLYFKQPIKIKTSTKYTYSMKRVSGGNADFRGTINNQILIRKKDGTIAERIGMPDFQTNTFNQTLTATYVFDDTIESIIGIKPIMYAVGNLTSPIIMQFQLEEGTQATSYEPYKSNILTVNEEVELREVGDVKDELDLLTGEVTERIGEVVLNGSENWAVNNTQTTTTNRFILNGVIKSDMTDATLSWYMVDKLPKTKWSDSCQFGITLSNGKIFLYNNSIEYNIPALKSWLSQNPITIQYQLATPITEKIGLSEDDYVGKSKVTYQLAEPLRKVGTYSDFIEGKTLYSNIGVEVLNGSENIAQRGETLENTLLFVTHLTDLGIKSNLIYSDKFDGTDISWNEVITSDKEFIRLYTNDTNALYIRILKSKLATQDVNGFKKWLQANPVTIYYVKTNPVEIPLKEVSPLDVDFSLNRQFKRGYENYLKELPNGVKDVLENGKVKRITNTITYTGKSSEEWKLMNSGAEVNTVGFVIELSNARPTQNINDENVIANLDSFNYNLWDTDLEGYSIFKSTSRLAIKVRRDKLTEVSVSGFKKMLNTNPLHVIYELVTPVTEELTEDNIRYVPYMPLNSYVGSLYVADGINRTKFLTDFSPSGYEVQTYHRYFSNEFNMFENITLKKSPYGHKTYLEEVDGKYVEKFIAGLEKHEIEDLRHKVSLTGFDYSQLLQDSFLKLIKGELS